MVLRAGLQYPRSTYALRRWDITEDIKMVADEIGNESVVIIVKYANFNLKKFKDDFLSIVV